MRPASKSLKSRSSLGTRLIHRGEGHANKTETSGSSNSHFAHQHEVTFINQTRASDPRIDFSTSKEVFKLQIKWSSLCSQLWQNQFLLTRTGLLKGRTTRGGWRGGSARRSSNLPGFESYFYDLNPWKKVEESLKRFWSERLKSFVFRLRFHWGR